MTAAVLLLVLALPAIAAAVPFQLAYTLPHPAPAIGDFFGASVALGSGRLAVGAPRRDLTGTADAGTVYLHDVATGGLVTPLLAPTPAVDARLGTSVAIDGVVAAGAPHENTGQPHAGAVHLFGLGGGHVQSIPNPAPGFDDVFGGAVAVRGDDLVAGARLDGAGLANAGAAWHLGVGGGVRHTLLAPTPAAYADFGQSVALGANDVVVGAPSDDTVAANAGAAYVYAAGALRWTLRSPPPALGDDFGRAVAIGDTLVAVGAPLDESERVAHAGAVYLFDLATGALVRRLTSPNAQPSGRFGAAVAFRGGDVIVGAPFEDVDDLPDVGVVYVFDPVGTVIATIANPTPNADDQFGVSLATDGGATLVVGAWHDDQAAQDAGAVHVFVDVGTPTTTTLPGATTTSTTLSIPSTSVSTTSTSVTTTTATTGPGSSSTTTTTTTVDGGSSTTTTISQLPASTTTTLPIACTPGVPFVCDDRDACTTDVCEGVCTWTPVVGLDGVTCRLDTMGAAMQQAGPVALGGRRAAQRLERQLGAVRRLVERARRATGRQATTRLRRARRALAKYVVTVERSRSKARMSGTLADGLLTLAAEAAQRLEEAR